GDKKAGFGHMFFAGVPNLAGAQGVHPPGIKVLIVCHRHLPVRPQVVIRGQNVFPAIGEPKAFWVTNEEAPMQVEPLRSEVELSGLSILRKQPPKHFSSHLSWIHILSSKAFDKRKLFT
ncbi:TPA: hypothetical protein ACOEOA_004616, partial [Stenotrophomonas maltophilia]